MDLLTELVYGNEVQQESIDLTERLIGVVGSEFTRGRIITKQVWIRGWNDIVEFGQCFCPADRVVTGSGVGPQAASIVASMSTTKLNANVFFMRFSSLTICVCLLFSLPIVSSV